MVTEAQGLSSSVGKFLKEFHDAPHHSEQARTFINQMCPYMLRWFAIASVDNVYPNEKSSSVSSGGGLGFLHVVSFVGYLIEFGLLDRELMQRHLTKPLTTTMIRTPM